MGSSGLFQDRAVKVGKLDHYWRITAPPAAGAPYDRLSSLLHTKVSVLNDILKILRWKCLAVGLIGNVMLHHVLLFSSSMFTIWTVLVDELLSVELFARLVICFC